MEDSATLGIMKILHIRYAMTADEDATEIYALSKAYDWNLKDTTRERRKIQQSRLVSETQLMRMLVPWSVEL